MIEMCVYIDMREREIGIEESYCKSNRGRERERKRER